MNVYKKMFFRMALGVEDAIRALTEAQIDCEDLYVNSPEFNPSTENGKLVNILDILEKKENQE